MVTEAFETYVIVSMLGFIVGVVVSRYFYKHRIQQKNIGQAIDFAVIEKQVTQLKSMTTTVNSLVDEIKACSDDILERIELIKDVEESLVPREKKLDRADAPHDFDQLTEQQAVGEAMAHEA